MGKKGNKIKLPLQKKWSMLNPFLLLRQNFTGTNTVCILYSFVFLSTEISPFTEHFNFSTSLSLPTLM
jgi:hypothetical protein